MKTQHVNIATRTLAVIAFCTASLFVSGGSLNPSAAETPRQQSSHSTPTQHLIENDGKDVKAKAFKKPPVELLFAQSIVSTPYRFLIPEGYVGWVRVDFDVPTAPPLTIEDGYYIFKFPKSGRLQTSSSDSVESRRNQFFYYSDTGKYLIKAGGPLNTRLVQEEFSGPGPGHPAPVPNRYRYIFIGPREVFEKHRALDTRLRPKESDGYPKVGAHTWLSQDELDKVILKHLSHSIP